MDKFWTFMSQLHSLAGPIVMLLYPLYASVMAMESTSKVDDEQWLAYWIFYSFLTLVEIVLEPVLTWIPIWYTVKLGLVAWLVLPQFRGAAFMYNTFVREKLLKQYGGKHFQNGSPIKKNNKLTDFMSLAKKREE
ncbi:HVA22-like protein d [Ranunculus cassubicifolius]